jgi:hypothetical protein
MAAVFNVLAWTNILDPQVTDQNKRPGTGPFTFASGCKATISR